MAVFNKPYSGTLGYFASNGRPGIISAGHVMVHEEETRLLVPPDGSTYNSAREHDLQHKVANVTVISAKKSNVDCGFAELTVGVECCAIINDIQVEEKARRNERFVGDVVSFHGSTSGRVQGIVTSDTFIFEKDGRGFKNQIRLIGANACSHGGDSGALMIDEDLTAIGLVIANHAGPDGDGAVANRIYEVEEVLKVDIITNSRS